MPRFNAPAPAKPGHEHARNLAGGEAYDRDPKVALASLVLTSLVQDTFYRTAEQQLADLAAVARSCAQAGDLLYCAKAAVYARREHGLRTITHALAAEVAQLRGEFSAQRGSWGPAFFERIVARPDDASEIAACWLGKYGARESKKGHKTLPNAMKRGFAKVLGKMSPHSLSKYDGSSTRSLTLRQLAHLVHPAGPKESAIYKLRGGALPPAETWEVALTQAGQKAKEEGVELDKGTAWRDVLAGGKLGYFALLRNARNIVENAPDQADTLCKKLADADAVRGSKILPFQFLAAFEALKEKTGPAARQVLASISAAIDLALSNVPKLEGATLVALDDSGSMLSHGRIPWHKQPAVFGGIFVAALARANADCDVMLFSEDAKMMQMPTGVPLLAALFGYTGALRGCGTNYAAPFQAARRKYDRIIVLSDAQGWRDDPELALAHYEQRTGARPRVYSWDLVGSSTQQLRGKRATPIAGISDKVFDLLKLAETDPKAMVSAIEAVTLS